jgi:hypothetical protein
VTQRPAGWVCLGRRPLAWHEREPSGSSSTLDRFAGLEHVAITAFVELAAQLVDYGAPAQLIGRYQAAADYERRDVGLLVELGGARPSATPEPAGPASLLAIALHNAVEGCVMETWAALLAADQAQRAPEPPVATRRALGLPDSLRAHALAEQFAGELAAAA